MGSTPYRVLETLKLQCNHDNIVLEIGSENGEGSSLWLYEWAKRNNIEFISVDVEHRKRERDYPWINWVVTESGSNWCKDVLPGLNKKIKVLYLDNFDWTPEESVGDQWIVDQINHYAQRGIVMNNDNCQQEHLAQFQHCLPYLDEECVVIMDDTYYNSNNILTGKCATVIPVLLENGFKLHHTQFATRGLDEKN